MLDFIEENLLGATVEVWEQMPADDCMIACTGWFCDMLVVFAIKVKNGKDLGCTHMENLQSSDTVPKMVTISFLPKEACHKIKSHQAMVWYHVFNVKLPHFPCLRLLVDAQNVALRQPPKVQAPLSAIFFGVTLRQHQSNL